MLFLQRQFCACRIIMAWKIPQEPLVFNARVTVFTASRITPAQQQPDIGARRIHIQCLHEFCYGVVVQAIVVIAKSFHEMNVDHRLSIE